ncbi:DNA-binding transcriptional LysR family regulator [Paraburkholderia sp. WSM4177]|nr:DNA-binding transcriptional LysR family regulator [Paraburkholderia sp. WSM4177]MBB5482796.1 DNA-binding transcriptional LysR family regulator [Paraburkholderia sp. WSM4180]
MSRAIAFLETHTGTPLLHGTTRTIRLSEAGERYALACRRILADLEEADLLAADERSAPRGLPGVTAAVAVGEEVLHDFGSAHGLSHGVIDLACWPFESMDRWRAL